MTGTHQGCGSVGEATGHCPHLGGLPGAVPAVRGPRASEEQSGPGGGGGLMGASWEMGFVMSHLGTNT